MRKTHRGSAPFQGELPVYGTKDSGDSDKSWPPVSILVPTWNDPRLALCLASLIAQRYAGAVEIVVIDNGSQESLAPLEVAYPGVRFLVERQPGSYAARNKGLAVARGEVVAFTDSDCIADPDWLSCGVRSLLKAKGDAVVGGKIGMFLVNPDHPEPAAIYNYATGFRQWATIWFRGFTPTANLITYRNSFDTVGPFANIFSGGDWEWCRRARAAGHKLVYCHGAVVRHPARENAAGMMALMRRTIAGRRALERRPTACVFLILKQIVLLPVDIMRIFGPRGRRFRLDQKLSAAGFACCLRGAAIMETMKLGREVSSPPR